MNAKTRTSVEASLASQHARPVLIIAGGSNSIRVVFVGGATYEIAADFASTDAAFRAMQTAIDMAAPFDARTIPHT